MFSPFRDYFHLAFMLAFVFLGNQQVAALAPYELLLVVNQSSPRSLEIANRYLQLRDLPPENVLYLDLSASVLAPAAEISPDDFTRQIWQPLDQTLRARGLLGRILAVAYSADFPVRVTTTPPVSLTGLTFVHNQLPPPGLIATGSFQSVFFAGPSRPDGPSAGSHSLRWFCDTPPHRLLPLPAMLLGHAGARGLEIGEILQTLERATNHVAKLAAGSFVFQTNDDVRSRMRAWQCAAARTELQDLGANAVITNAPQTAAMPVAGLMSGMAWPAKPQAAFQPGAYADHCTSFAALFHRADQTKLTLWLRGGATLSAGTVSEPYSIWTKFPNARFFAHQVRGCSAIECFALSVRCPLQLLPVGDPLAAPYAPSLAARLAVKGDAQRLAALIQTTGVPTGAIVRYSFFLDGRCVEREVSRPGIAFDTTGLSDGCHRLMAVAALGETVQFSAQATAFFSLNRHGHMPVLTGLKTGDRLTSGMPGQLKITAPTEARETGLLQGERLLARGTNREFILDPAQLGIGVVELQAAAWYADGSVCRSEPIHVEVVRAVPPAEPAECRSVDLSADAFSQLGKKQPATEGVTYSTTNTYALWTAPIMNAQELAVTLTPSDESLTSSARAGLAFNIRDEKNFDFFGLVGESSGWTLAKVRDGNFSVVVERGWPVRVGTAYRIGLRASGRDLECLVNREVIFAGDKIKLEGQPFGVGVSGSGATFAGFSARSAKGKP